MIRNPSTWVRVLRHTAWAALLVAIFTAAFGVSSEQRPVLVAAAVPLALSAACAAGAFLRARAPMRGTARVQKVLQPERRAASGEHRRTIQVVVDVPGYPLTETTLRNLTVPADVLLQTGGELPIEIRRGKYPATVRVRWDRIPPTPKLTDADLNLAADLAEPPPWARR